MRATPKFASHARYDYSAQRALVETRAEVARARGELRALDAELEEAHARARIAREIAPPAPAPTLPRAAPPLDAYKTLRLAYDFAAALRML